MIIKHVEIKEFGPLEDFSADLLPGVNLIEGVNESGKSSIIGFLRFVLYGLPARRGEEGAAERDRALSWKSSAADGSITVESEGKEYRRAGKLHRPGSHYRPCHRKRGTQGRGSRARAARSFADGI